VSRPIPSDAVIELTCVKLSVVRDASASGIENCFFSDFEMCADIYSWMDFSDDSLLVELV
jgi:hypothetical protein